MKTPIHTTSIDFYRDIKALLHGARSKVYQTINQAMTQTYWVIGRRFYLAYSNSETPSRNFTLSWSHYIFLARISNPSERSFYEIEASNNHWCLKNSNANSTGLFESVILV